VIEGTTKELALLAPSKSMVVKKSHYEELLACYSNHVNAIELLKQYRPYLETVPSMRRLEESLITIPLPVVQVRPDAAHPSPRGADCSYELICLPCDIAFLMCDPEWKIKTGVEIFIFIHRPQEDFSQLLSRWRQTQVLLSKGYSWEMPLRYKHVFSEGAEKIFPLFVLFSTTAERIKRGLKGAYLPFVVQVVDREEESDFDFSEAPEIVEKLGVNLESGPESGSG
jgi:hypothetical protein